MRAASRKGLLRRCPDLSGIDAMHADEQQQVDQVLDPRVGRLPGTGIGVQLFIPLRPSL